MTPIRAWSEDNVSLTALAARQYQPTSGIDIPDRPLLTTVAQSNGVLRVTFHTPTRTMNVSNFTVACTTGATDSGGTTVRKLGLFTVGANYSTLTCVARSANDTSLGTTSATLYTKAFTSESGYSSSYTLLAGTTYAIGWLFYNTGGTFNGPTMVAFGPSVGSVINSNTALTPMLVTALSSQTDITNSTLNIVNLNSGNGPFMRLT